jgi:hypothetical protein
MNLDFDIVLCVIASLSLKARNSVSELCSQ